jgi:4-diphosphocytidyl-2-C-methyl-D-erythritol kinase
MKSAVMPKTCSSLLSIKNAMTTSSLICLAPAKLNLFLHITGRRADGYHTLQTIFQFIDLCDELEFQRRADGEIHLRGEVPGVAPEKNLIWRAARLLQQESGTRWGADIGLDKKIPMGGGLGGGSSDAATTLLALNRLWQLDWPARRLAELGLRLGADVPVFAHGKAAWAEGIGEILTPLENLPQPWYLVLHPGCQVPTAEIFQAPELTRNTPAIRMQNFLFASTGNDCETAVTARYPQIRAALDWLSHYGQARLTGTGACIFAAFSSREEAEQAEQKISAGWRAWVVRGLNRSPALV